MNVITTPTAAEERQRMAAIMGLSGATARPRLAGALAVETSLSPAKAEGVLDAAAGKGRFAHLGTATAQAALTGWQKARAVAEGHDPTPVAEQVRRIVAAGRRATGHA